VKVSLYRTLADLPGQIRLKETDSLADSIHELRVFEDPPERRPVRNGGKCKE